MTFCFKLFETTSILRFTGNVGRSLTVCVVSSAGLPVFATPMQVITLEQKMYIIFFFIGYSAAVKILDFC